jgi:hypothetical protein
MRISVWHGKVLACRSAGVNGDETKLSTQG